MCRSLALLEPGVVIMALGNPITTAALRKEGVRVVEVDMTVRASNYLASPLCMTGPLIRDDGPFLDDLRQDRLVYLGQIHNTAC